MRSFVRTLSMSLAVACGAMLWTVGPAEAQPREATVITTDGRELTGQLVVQNDRVVVLSISGIETTIRRGDVAELEVQQTPAELYDAVRPTLDEGDLAGRLDLTQRMIELDAFALARRELADLSRSFPGDPRIARVDTQLTAREELSKQKSQATPDEASDRQGSAARRNANERPDAGQLLNEDQINLIRVYEIDLDERPRGIRFTPEMLQEFFKVYRDADNRPLDRRAQSAFRRLPPYEQLAAVFSTQNRGLYGGVRIANDPPALGRFRGQVNGAYIARYFKGHFGEGQVPGIELVASRPNSVEEAYTNFYVLNQYVGPTGVPMIDRRNPAESLLLQWGLPREVATSPAPDVEGWRPHFRSLNDPRFTQMVEWIETLFPTSPRDYGFTFSPGGSDAPAEATEQAPAPETAP